LDIAFEIKNVVGNYANLREMFAKSKSRTVPVISIGEDSVVGFDRAGIDRLLRKHGLQDA
jgi:glutaredoxin